MAMTERSSYTMGMRVMFRPSPSSMNCGRATDAAYCLCAKRKAKAREYESGPIMSRIQEWLADLGEDIRESCAEKKWPARLLLWVWLTYISLQHFRDFEYNSFLGGLNLGIHEFGHLICQPFGQLITILGGSLVQCLVPVISFFMFWRQRDYFAWTFSLVWLSTNMEGVARYIADARKLELELVSPFGGDGEVIHDWNWLLNHWDILSHEQEIAHVLRVLAIIVSFIGVAWGAYTLWIMIRSSGKEEEWKMPT